MNKTIFTYLLLMASFLKLSAQIKSDSLFSAKAKENAITSFERKYGAQLAINKGTIFRPISQIEYYGTTILGENLIYKGNVLFNEQWYNAVDLAYDIKSDNLIHIKPTNEWIVLLKPVIENFTLGSLKFINVRSKGEIEEGFYELVVAGQTQLLAKHYLSINRFHPGTYRREIEQRKKYFIQNKDSYFAVSSKSSLIKALDDKKKEVNDFIKQKSISFSGNNEYAIKTVVEFYNGLN